MVKKTFPYSTTKDVLMTWEEMNKSCLLTKIPETTQIQLEKMRKRRYEEREKRLVFTNFLEMVKKTFPYSTTKDVLMTWEEMNKSCLLTKIPETTQGFLHCEAEPSQKEKGDHGNLR
ncbi:hypothetical protein DAPPUDRAFT_114656 [Daphnia pulex]|uniref:Uncharacterized protein n=1 Tax=Daphnia pulex TaxID=6669 RepID=E9HIV9_DAPPU|nr:hypothetical protein DAPPUDRAFT_114656 [Daphnia pulex]|eukprot:EFX68341.1 hypothetical protein DAPPUDRAFT_114656 [Daphnia pulex]